MKRLSHAIYMPGVINKSTNQILILPPISYRYTKAHANVTKDKGLHIGSSFDMMYSLSYS